MKLKLDKKDRKILNQLDLNCRQSDAKIGKKTRISKQVVNYRIGKLLDKNIITTFFPHVNIAKLGYAIHKVYIQFKSLGKEKEKEMWNYLKEQNNIVWAILCSGEWDLIFGIVSKDIQEFDNILTDFMNKYSKFVNSRAITVFNKATLHHRKWFIDDKKSVYWQLGGKKENVKLDKTDKKILKQLNRNARKPTIEIAKETGISSSLVIQRIKKLQKKGIIQTFRTAINREKLGMNYCKAFIYYQNKTSQKEKQLLNYCYMLKNILGVSQSIGPWDLELEFEVENYDKFHKIMKKTKNKFPLVSNFNTVYIEKEYGLSFLPNL